MHSTLPQKVISYALFSLISGTALAIPAKPGLLNITQNDGTEVSVRLIGDENAHVYTTPSGALLSEVSGQFYLADIDASGKLVPTQQRYTSEPSAKLQAIEASAANKAIDFLRRQAKRSAKKSTKNQSGFPGLFPNSEFPVTGSPRALVILIEYSDVSMSQPNASDYFTRLLTEPGFSDYGGTGCAEEYFKENSLGKFTPQFDVVGPVKLSRQRQYYGGNNSYGQDLHPEEMVIEACQLLDDQIDFSIYDTNNDGKIDNVFVFYAGRGENDGGGANTIWPHSSNISNLGEYLFDGVQLDYYACSNEWQGTRPDGIGTFIHEFSHVMGLPDLYATDYTDAFTPGPWSVLDAGPYNNNSCTPPNYSAFERYALGWFDPVVIDTPTSATIPPISSNVAGIIQLTGSNEYYLFENRYQEGWDSYLPGHGMLVWHVDYKADVWQLNSVNNTATHQYVDLIEADGIPTAGTRSGDSFPGASGINTLSSSTNPALKWWNGTGTGLTFTNISEDGKLLNFCINDGVSTITEPEVLEAEDISGTSFTAKWQGTADSYYLSVFSISGDNRKYVKGYELKRIEGTQKHTVEGLEHDTEYYFTVRSAQGLEMSAESSAMPVQTGLRPITDRQVTALAATEITPGAFTANWEELEGAESYLLSVYTKIEGDPIETTEGFDNGIAGLSEGWQTTATATYSMASWAGTSTPSLRFGTDGDYIRTPEFMDGIRTFSFWHRGNGTDSESSIEIEALTGGEWQSIAQYAITTTQGGSIIKLENIREGATAVRLTFNRAAGNLAIDDIVIGHGASQSKLFATGYESFDAGSNLTCRIDGLDSDKNWYYTVQAKNDEGLSIPSEEIEVLASSGITEAVASAIRIHTEGLLINIVGMPKDSTVTLYTPAGQIVREIKALAGHASLTAPAPGIYILRAGCEIRKIIIH